LTSGDLLIGNILSLWGLQKIKKYKNWCGW